MGPFKNLNVRLSATVAPYQAQLARASRSTREFGGELAQVASRGDQTTKTIGRASALFGGALLGGLALATRANMNFEKSISGVVAVAPEAAGRMNELREAALKAGADTSFSASQAADAEAELVKAGVSVSDVLGGALRGSLDLAAAGQLELADAATIAAQAMNIFDLRGRDVAHIADVLAAGANKSAADVSQLGRALRQGGLVAAQTGLSLEETVGTLAMFADNALIGSDAGTSLKTMLMRLTPSSQEAAELMERLGFTAYDATGQFVGMEELAKRMTTAFGGMAPEVRNAALQTIFGADAIRGANIVLSRGAEGVRDYTEAVNDQGAAGKMAAAQLDNLSGDLEQLRGSIETALIEGGSVANDALRSMVQSVTGLVNVFGDLTPGMQKVVVLGGAIVGMLALLGGGFLMLAPKIKAARDLYVDLTKTMPRLATASRLATLAMGGIGIALAVATPLLMGYAKRKAEASAKTQEFAAALAAEADGLDGEVDKLIASELAQKDLVDRGKELGFSTSQTVRAIKEGGDVLADYKDRIDGATGSLVENGDSVLIAGQKTQSFADDVDYLSDRYSEGVDKAADLAESEEAVGVKAEGAIPGVEGLEGGLEELEDPAEMAAKALARVKDAVDEIIGVHLNAEAALVNVRQSLVDLTDALAENGATLDANTEQGRKNRLEIIDTAEGIVGLIGTLKEEGRTTDEVRSIVGFHVQALADTMRQAGLTEAEVREYLRTLGLTPKNIETILDAEKEVAEDNVDEFGRHADTAARPRTAKIDADTGGAHAKVSGLAGLLDAVSGKRHTVNVDIYGRTSGPGVNTPSGASGIEKIFRQPGAGRWGLAYEMAAGDVLAHVASSPTVLFGERQTGGEAFVPKRGNASRSLSILDVAAGWYGHQLVPMQAGGVIGTSLGIPLRALGGNGGTDLNDVARLVVAAVDRATQRPREFHQHYHEEVDPVHAVREAMRQLA